MDLEQTKKRIEAIENLQREIREAKEMLKEELEADPGYREIADEANEITTKKKKIKAELENSGSNKKLLETIKENSEEISTLKEILSAELMQIYTEQKADEITDANGNVRKIQVQARLKSKGTNYEGRDQMGQYTPGDK